MSDIPEAVDGWVCYEQPNEPVLKDPAEAEALAMNLLSAACEARAFRLADIEDVPEAEDVAEEIADEGAGAFAQLAD